VRGLEVADKLVGFVIVTICVAVALGLIASVSHVVEPSADVAVLHSAISSVALRPGSKVVVNIYVPKASSITIRDSALTVASSSIPVGYVKAMDKVVGIVSSVDESSIVYKVWLSELELAGGLTYTLSVECAGLNNVTIKVLSYRQLAIA